MMDDVRRHERNKEGLFVTGTPCNDCGGNLIYSARELGTGLCHRCAHHRYAELLDTLKIAQEPVDTNDLR